MKSNLKSFHNTRMENITRNDVDRLHAKLKQDVSVYTANRAIGLLGCMFKMACEWGNNDEMYNPVTGIKKFKEASRDRFIQPAELQVFFQALEEETNYQFRDFIALSLLIGQRRSNMLSMRWENVNLVDQDMPFAYFPDSKNGEPQRIPLSTQAYDILKNMKKRQGNPAKGWVFPSEAKKSTSGHIEDYHRPWYALLERAGLEDLRFHDLRRTFGSYQAISGSSTQIIGKALGDKSQIATLVYSRLTLDPVRESIQRGADKMFEFVGNKGGE
jgi:integrase